MDVDGKLEGIAHVHVTILGIEIILLTSLKIRQGLKLRVCFSKLGEGLRWGQTWFSVFSRIANRRAEDSTESQPVESRRNIGPT